MNVRVLPAGPINSGTTSWVFPYTMHILDSCFYLSDRKAAELKTEGLHLFLDSGAFSAWSKGVEIDLDAYCEFIKKYEDCIDVYCVLDVIGDPVGTWKNQRYMEEEYGLDPMPVFHQGEDWKYLERCFEYDYFALGGMAKMMQRVEFLENAFTRICDTEDGMPIGKVHGFGMTSFVLMRRFPWFSVDSTSWLMTSRFGAILVPARTTGRWNYGKNPFKVSISERSPAQQEEGSHFDNMIPELQEAITGYVEGKGFTIEQCRTDYKVRDQMNIIYFKDFEEALPSWPWEWHATRKPKTRFF